MEILQVENLGFTYPTLSEKSLDGVTFSLKEGEFAVLTGETGSGKSTLLRLLKKELAPKGKREGGILIEGAPIERLSPLDSAGKIGFVMQNPALQTVTDKVYHELSFGLENLAVPTNTIRRRVAEMADYFGIEPWFEKNVSELSGGELQLLNLSAVMVMNPKILILDEPTAGLDPIAAADFIATLKKLNEDFSLTVLIAEHRLESLLPAADRLLVLKEGKLLQNGTPRRVLERLSGEDTLLSAMPAAVRLAYALEKPAPCPLTVREGREWIRNEFPPKEQEEKETPPYRHSEREALTLKDVCFRYGKKERDVLSHLHLTVYEGESFFLLGANGSGKSTFLSTVAGLLKPYYGRISVLGKPIETYTHGALYQGCLSLLPQDVSTVFLRDSVEDELKDAGISPAELPFDVTPFKGRHPFDLSGGEQQLLALAKVLATRPRLLLLDEPTKGLDAQKKEGLITILRTLQKSGVTVVAVTHDVEFAALAADRVALFFRGNAVSTDTPAAFFSENQFYTTAAARMAKGLYPRAVTVKALADACRYEAEEKPC